MSNDGNKHVEICCHNISYYFGDTDMEIDDTGKEHIEKKVCEGIIEGDLNVTDSSDNTFYGYWHIEQ